MALNDAQEVLQADLFRELANYAAMAYSIDEEVYFDVFFEYDEELDAYDFVIELDEGGDWCVDVDCKISDVDDLATDIVVHHVVKGLA